MNATGRQNELAAETATKAVVLYDDFKVVAEATPLLNLLSPPPDNAFRWNVKSYPFDQLKQPAAADTALGEAADADLIVVAINNPGHLPSWIASWLETWAVQRRVRDPDFVALGSGVRAGHARSGSHELRRFAGRHGLSCAMTRSRGISFVAILKPFSHPVEQPRPFAESVQRKPECSSAAGRL